MTKLEHVPDDSNDLLPLCPRQVKSTLELFTAIEDIYHIRDLDTLLDGILYEARTFVDADAGTIYLSAGGRLYFSYIQNDTLFGTGNSRSKYLCGVNSIPINKNSIAGYVGATGEPLLIDDVYDIMSSVSYSFNPAIDKKSSYRTQSLLVIPLVTREGAILGVLQLINAKDGRGNTVPFSMTDRFAISQFAQSAANAIEKAKMTREMILRLVETVELKDKSETINHVQRVGAYAVELYSAWAKYHGVSVKDANTRKDHLRTAAILHDLGKSAVKKKAFQNNAPLSEEEKQQAKMHTIHGARFFHRFTSAWDKVAFDVSLGHHEHWNGTGYPGRVNIFSDKPVFGAGKRGKEIPLSARIAVIADTFDSVCLCGNGATSPETACGFIASHSGSRFDPELVRIFLGLKETMQSIWQTHRDSAPAAAE